MKRFPLSVNEYGMYVEQNATVSTAYNLPICIKLDSSIDEQRLISAIKEAVRLHPSMNTAFAADENGEVYKYLRDCEPEVRVLNMEHPAFNSLVRPFDLQEDVLFRFCLIRDGSSRWLFYDIHHIIFDGLSNSILLNDINDIYNGKKPESEAFDACEYAVEESYRLSSEEYKKARQYYLDTFDGVESDPSFFTDRNGRESENTELSIRLVSVDHAMLRQAADSYGVRVSTIFNAAFAFVLARYSGSEQVLYATAYHGRDDRLSRSAGMFVKTYPVYADLSSCKTTSGLITALDRHITGNRENSLFPYSDFCRDTRLKPQILFSYQGDLLKSMDFCGMTVTPELLPVKDVKSSFELTVRRVGDGFEAFADYDQSLYDDEIIRAMLEAFDKVLHDMLTDIKLSELDMLTDGRLAELDSRNCPEDASVEPFEDIVNMFRERADSTPEDTAVVFLDQVISYSELDQVTDNIAAYLRARDIGKEDIVAVLIPRSENMVIASLGVLKTGAAYQPLDPIYPVERLRFMLGDTHAKFLIADRSLMTRLSDYNGPVLYTDEIPLLPDAKRVRVNIAPEDLFIVLYTSGSTGVPKGVMLEHGNITAFCRNYAENFSLDSSSRVAAYASYGFDAHLMDMYPALITGAQIHIIEEGLRSSLLAIKDYFNQNHITHSFMTTQIGRQYADIFPDADYPHYLLTGGERLVPVAPPTAYDLYNVYGPAECTVFTNRYKIDRLYDRVPIGKAMSGTRQYVVDKNGRRLPPGAPGELIIAGSSVGRGYLDRPELNSRVFIKNPFSDDKGFERAYRTGDIVRLLSNGCIDYIGRNDSQVKVRGFRVELGEVESIIRRFPGIKDATVQSFDDPDGGSLVAAYIVSDELIKHEELDAFILENKPPYMLPSVTIQLNKIPLNRNQKVNRRALPIPQKTNEDLLPPQNELQKKIFDCIARVIGTTAFGINTDIFYAGLSSIGALRLNVMLSNRFDVPVSLADLRRNNTVLGLEKYIYSSKHTGVCELLPDYPLTQTQKLILTRCLSDPGTAASSMRYLFRLSDRLRPEMVRSAAEAAINAHPYIKTRLIADENGELRAARNDDAPAEAELISINELPRQLSEPFSLIDSKLYRVRVYVTRKGTYLYLEFHQLICDGPSARLIIEDISSAYRAADPMKEDYTGFEAALEEEKERHSEAFAKAKRYYDSIFGSVDSYLLPKRDVFDKAKSPGSVSVRTRLDLHAIQQFCERQGVTENTFFTCVFAIVLAKYRFKDEAVFLTSYNDRADERLARSAAMLDKIFPVYCRLDGSTKVGELLRRTGEQLADSISNSVYSTADIAESCGLIGDVIFKYLGQNNALESICGEKAEAVPLPEADIGLLLGMCVEIKNKHIEFLSHFRSDMYSEEMIRGFASCMEKAASELLYKEKLSELSIMTESSQKAIDTFNETSTDVLPLPVSQLFEDMAKRNPLKAAVISDMQLLTYKQLKELSCRIAGVLLAHGVSTGEPVGVMMPRVCELYAVHQGILRAGAAFVPLTADCHRDKAECIFRKSGIRFVITDNKTLLSRSDMLAEAGVTALTIETLSSADDPELPENTAGPDTLCCCIYNTDHNGRLRGVELTNRALANLVNWNPMNLQACCFCDNMTVSLALADLASDIAVLEEELVLCNGGTIALATESEVRDPLLLADMIKRTRADVMRCTPSFLSNILDMPRVVEALKQLRAINTGSEVFPQQLFERLRSVGVSAKVFNSYGHTESGISSCVSAVMNSHITLGKPICNTGLHIIDSSGNELPLNVPGELIISGDGIARGYADDKELTGEYFFTYNGKPALRTGDIALRSADGKLTFMGRKENRVMFKGRRLELDEIRNAINSYPAVKNSIVLIRPGKSGERILCAYYTAAETVKPEALKAHLNRKLLNYMIPSSFICLKAFPLDRNGRIDKHSLPEPVSPSAAHEYTIPVTELQKKLAELFAFVLGKKNVGTTDSFFDLGGNFLSASRLVIKASAADISILLRDIYENPTVLELEKHIIRSEHKDEEQTDDDNNDSPELQLINNIIDNAGELTEESLGNVLLTGATGFLGIHVLKKLIDLTDKTVYCLLLKDSMGVEAKLANMLMYYFEGSMGRFLGSRIRVIEGDVTDRKKILSLSKYDFDTVINCASTNNPNADDDEFERVNVGGVQNIIELCASANKRLVHISTVNVAGTSVENSIPASKRLHENELFFGQCLENTYINTRFQAEQAVLRAISRQDLNARIIRVGNLMSRFDDGQFHISSITNSFISNLRAFASIGKISGTMLSELVELSPIDCTAEAVVRLAGACRDFTVFHATNDHRVQMSDIISAMNSTGVYIETVSDEEFYEAYRELLEDVHMNSFVSSTISCFPSDDNPTESYIEHDSSFTSKILSELGFRWPEINEYYLSGLFDTLDNLGYFDCV